MYISSHQGIFHSKVWYFEKGAEYTSCLIGSANLTFSALNTNLETSILIEHTDNPQVKKDFKHIFEIVWEKDCLKLNKNLINNLIENQKTKKEILKIFNQEKKIHEINTQDSVLKYIEHWIKYRQIEFPDKKKEKIYGKNGWYLINNQWNMNDKLISHLQEICKEINKSKNINCKDDREFEQYKGITKLMSNNPSRRQKESKLTIREAWIRQEKRVLIDIGFITEINKTIFLSQLGKKFIEKPAQDLTYLKKIYTESLAQKKCFNIYPLQFFNELIIRLDKYLNKEEFAYFIQYAREKDDLELVYNLILVYREMSEKHKIELKQYVDSQLGVDSSLFYRDTSIKMSLIGCCENLLYNKDSKEEIIIRV